MPSFTLRVADEAAQVLTALGAAPQYEGKLKKVRRTLGRIQQNPRHPGLNSHKYDSIAGVNGEEVWESYVENKTPSAWRIFWHYGPEKGVITVLTIGPHP